MVSITGSGWLVCLLIHPYLGQLSSQLSFSRANILKHTLRTLHRMMQTSGTSEGLRGLIDSSLIKSIKEIIEHRALFGPSVLPIGEYIELVHSVHVLRIF